MDYKIMNELIHLVNENKLEPVMAYLENKKFHIKEHNVKNSPLHIAVGNWNIKMVKLLLEKMEININCRDYAGKTCLFYACELACRFRLSNNLDLINFLLCKGADPNKTNHCRVTPIMIACRKGHLALLKLLVKYGADIKSATAIRRVKKHLKIRICRKFLKAISKIHFEN